MRRAAARKSIYITSQLANLRIYIIKEMGVGDEATRTKLTTKLKKKPKTQLLPQLDQHHAFPKTPTHTHARTHAHYSQQHHQNFNHPPSIHP